MDEVLVAVDVPLVGDERRKSWAKLVVAVDETLASGWAYEGEFVPTGGVADLPVGGVLLVYGERGSRANSRPEAVVYRVNGDATLSELASAKGRGWARTLRDTVAELLAEEAPRDARRPWGPELLGYSDEAILDEVRRRGL